MARFLIEGVYYDAPDYITARALQKAAKAGSSGTPPVDTPKVVTPPASPKPSTSTPKMVARTVPVPPVIVPAVVVVAPPPAVGLASGLTLYRGDERAADVIARDGFQLWGDAVAAVTKAGGIADFILHKIYLAYTNERDIERYIVTAKDRSRPTISTSRNEGCGGYDSGNIFKIEYTPSELQEYAFDDVMKAYSSSDAAPKFPNFKLYMDTPSIKTAKQIALDLNIATQEVVFFRHVPGAKITRYKGKGERVFQAMPAAAARATLW